MEFTGERPEIWGTVGPEADDPKTIRELINAGVTGMRTSFSYATPEVHSRRAELIGDAAASVNRPCRVIADIPGEKVRLGDFAEAEVPVSMGNVVHFVSEDREFDTADNRFPVKSTDFFEYVREGDTLLVGDGGAMVEVTEARDGHLVCEATLDGELNPSRGLVVQDGEFEPASLTDADRNDVKYVAESGRFDALALSFVSDTEAVREARQILREADADLPIVAKIETRRGVENLSAIAPEVDAIMVARGDLALYLPWAELGRHTERIVEAANHHDVPWILATQVAEGLERFTFPTRAEICDLTRWLDEGMDGVLLSYETAFGPRPVDAVSSVGEILDADAERGHRD
jgi:pyruvate kinase